MLSHRYITDRFLPDKAIDLIDEAAASLRMEIDSLPVDIDAVERQSHSARNRTTGAQQGRRSGVEGSLACDREENSVELREKSTQMKLRWQREKELIQSVRSVKEQIEDAHIEEQQAEREGNYARVAELRYGKLQELEQQLKEANAKIEEMQQNERMLKEQVDEEDVARIVAKWTGIPVTQDARKRNSETGSHGRTAGEACRRPGRCTEGGRECDSSFPRRTAGSESSDRRLHVSRPDRRR